jgi:hypothetical protein
LFYAPSILSATNPAIDVPISLLIGGLKIFILVRFGMVAHLSWVAFGTVLVFHLFSWDLAVWYAGRSGFLLLIFAGVAAYAFRNSLAGRSLFGRDLFEVGVGSKG